jgi:LysM repeat protein
MPVIPKRILVQLPDQPMKRISLLSPLLLLVATPVTAQGVPSQLEVNCSEKSLLCRLKGIAPRPSELLNSGDSQTTASKVPDGLQFGVVRYGDTINAIARRYGLTLAQLLRLNPGLGTARLVIGSTFRISDPEKHDHWSTLVPLAVLPTSPEIPLPAKVPPPSQAPTRFDTSLDSLVSEGIVHPEERLRVQRGLISPNNPSRLEACNTGALSSFECIRSLGAEIQHREVCSSGALSSFECSQGGLIRRSGIIGTSPAPISVPLSPREQSLLNRIRQEHQPTWRRFGSCNYDWTGWKLNSSGIRTTSVECGSTSMRSQVGVSCTRLLVATHRTTEGWSKWNRPAGPDSRSRSGEDEMVAALCANVSK